ncbi:MAG: hypothetical protein ACREVL_07595 [Solimonas sp.]
MSFAVFSCSACDFRASSTVLWGACSYGTDEGLVPVERELAWCRECADLVTAEVLPSEMCIEWFEREIGLQVAVIAGEDQRLQTERPWYKRLFNMEASPPDHRSMDLIRLDTLKRNLSEEQTRLRLMAGRRSGARCLKCGGFDISYLPDGLDLYPEDNAPEEEKPIPFIHPDCGGTWMLTPSSFSISMRLTHRIFDTEGCFLRDQDK